MATPAVALLERVPEAEITTADLWGDLPTEAEAILGYKGLQQAQGKRQMMQVLQTANARPFTDESVAKYMQQVYKMTYPKVYWLQKRLTDGAMALVMITTAFCFGPALLFWFMSSVTWVPALIFSVIFVAGFATMLSTESKSFGLQPGQWQTADLKGYTQPVPEFVLQTALDVKRGLPEAEFTVHNFVQMRRVLDPFLQVTYQGNRAFIAVWDEPKFELEHAN